MTTLFSVASPAAITSGLWSRRGRQSFPSLTSTVYPIEKGTVQGLRAPKFCVFATTSERPVATKVETTYKDDERTKVLTKKDNLASVFKNVVISGRKASKNPKKLSSDAAPSNLAHTLFPVLKYPLGTEAAMKQIIERNTLVFVVDKRADKPAIKDSVEKMFKIRAQKVNTSIAPDGTKKAFIMLTRDFKAVDLAKSFKIM